VTFRVTWGGRHGADARRLLALACRRGSIRGSDVGAIRVEADYSLIDVGRGVADAFERDAGRPDPRDPRVRITRADEAPPRAPRAQSHPPRGAPHRGAAHLRHPKRKH
jgi:ATP-dependent RNA helicase DeaD